MSIKSVNAFFCQKKSGKRKRGRPRLKPEERMSVRRSLDLRPQEAVILDALAKESGQSFNAWARSILLTAAGQGVLRQEE